MRFNANVPNTPAIRFNSPSISKSPREKFQFKEKKKNYFISKVFNSAIGKWWVITHPNTENKDDNYLKVLSMMLLNAKQNSLITNYYATNERQMTSYS